MANTAFADATTPAESDNFDSRMGHNEIAARLGILAGDAQHALGQVAKGEGDALEGWLSYGAALNAGRLLFHPEDDKGFGQWVDANLLGQVGLVEVHPKERQAAMWAAAYPEQFEEARAAGSARTVRGIHAKWNEIDAERAAVAAREAAEAARKEAEARAALEAEARRKEREAKDEEARKAAALAMAEAAKASVAAGKIAKKAESVAASKEKRAAKVKAGNTSANDNLPDYRTSFTGENEWYTPEQHIELARRVLGQIDIDPASNDHAQKTVKAATYYTAETNGLDKEWNGKVWMNPPYSQPIIVHFVEKIIAEYESGRCEEAIMLTHNSTDTAWGNLLFKHADAMCFTKGRVKFESATGEKAATAMGQIFTYFGPNPERFRDVFKEVGNSVPLAWGRS